MFLELVHVRTDLTDIQKLHYLHSSLRDEALNVIKSLPITHNNYAVAIELLKARYDSKLIVSEYHVGNVLGVKSIQQESMAVSYTHLDVYKRQVCRCVLFSTFYWEDATNSFGCVVLQSKPICFLIHRV